MKARGISKVGVLSVVTVATVLTAWNGFAADQPPMGGNAEMKAKASAPKTPDVKALDEEVLHLEVVDSRGNAYLLIPLKTTGGNKPAVAEDGKIIVEYVHPYTGRLGN